MSDFQQTVKTTPAPGIAGDFADANPRASYDAGPGALIAGVGGVTPGLFAWIAMDSNGEPQSLLNTGSGSPDGFVARQGQNAVLSAYLQTSGGAIPAGFEATLHVEGGFWAKNDGGVAVAVNDAVYADAANGKASNVSGGHVATRFRWLTAAAAGEIGKITTHFGKP